ncbi:MAG: methylmalonyl-CoA epimerase [Firmicutes bacterium ML8_F2]|nr:MAG: methylmalonyl-CoA epimerase [Firmicutes bacterium ML8_F2]
MNVFEKVDHIGIAVADLDEALKLYRDQLGLVCKGTEVVEEQKVKVAFLPVGESKIELLESTDPEGPVGKFIEKKGGGVHHLSFRVSNIEEKLEQLKQQGVALIDQKPRYGAGGAKIAFLHPKSTGGVLIEICER